MAQRLMKNITEDYLTCSICWNIYSDPKMLHCGHTFCSECLKDYIKTKPKSKDGIDCPICRQPIETAFQDDVNEWINSLAPDTVSLSILKAIEVHNTPSSSTAETHAEDGGQATKLEPNGTGSIQYACSRHRDKELDVYCSKHDVVICSECAWRDHKDVQCECSSAKDVVRKRINALKCLVGQQANDASQLLSSDVENAKSAKSICDEFHQSIREVEESFAEVFVLFKVRISNLRQKARDILEKDFSISEIRRLQSQLVDKIQVFDNLSENRNPNESMRELSEMCLTSSELQINIHDLQDKVNTGSLMKYMEGDLNVLDAFVSSAYQNLPDECMTLEEIYKDEPSDKEYVMVTKSGKFADFVESAEQSLDNYKQFTFSAKQPDESQCMLSSVALLGTTAIVVVDQMNKKLKKLKIPEGQFLNELSVQFEPHQVATLRESSNIVVTVWEIPKVLIVSTDPVLQVLKVIHTDVEYIGVTSHVTDCVALASIQSRRVDIVNVNNPTSPLAKGETIYKSSRRRSFPDRMSTSKSGNIIIRNRRRKEIVCFNKHNVLLWSRRLKSVVSDVCCFRGRVFASLREKNEIVHFSEDGLGELQVLKSQAQLKHPWSMCGFKDCLVITEDSPSDTVHVFVFWD